MDTVTPTIRSQIMARVKGENTAPEMVVRKALHSAGYRYRLHRKDLPGRPDVVFSSYRLVVFIHGCFWHWHGCKRSRMPSSNINYWKKKIERNMERDRANQSLLNDDGWEIRIIWECQVLEGTRELLQRLKHKHKET